MDNFQVTGKSSSVYFDPEALAHANALLEALDKRSVSELIRDLIEEKYDQLVAKKVIKPATTKRPA